MSRTARDRSAPVRRLASTVGLLLCVIGMATPPLEASAAAQPPQKGKGESQASASAPRGIYAATFGRSGNDFLYVQYWSLGTRFRSETVVAGHPIVTIVNGAHYYMYDALTKAGYVITRSEHAQAADKTRKRPFANDLDMLLQDGGELVRSDALNGIPVDVYRVTNDQGRRTLWVTKDENAFPLRLERFERRGGVSSRLDWIDWLPGLAISENYFEPDTSVQLRRFGSYDEFLVELRKGPIAPAPPLFGDLIHQAGE